MKRNMNQPMTYVERLSLQQQFRLIEIAHETKDTEIRQEALAILQQYLHPPVFVASVPTVEFGPDGKPGDVRWVPA